VVAWGAIETAAFKRQSAAFADALDAAGAGARRCTRLEVPARNHFDVILDLAEPGTALGDATLALLRGEPLARP
jgi:arylformamidase